MINTADSSNPCKPFPVPADVKSKLDKSTYEGNAQTLADAIALKANKSETTTPFREAVNLSSTKPTLSGVYPATQGGTYTGWLDKDGVSIILEANKVNYIILGTDGFFEVQSVNIDVSGKVDKSDVQKVLDAENTIDPISSKAVSDFVSKATNYNYPFINPQLEETRLSFSLGIIELYIEDYNPLYNYSLRVARKNQNGLGVPDGYTQLSISVMNAGVFVKDYELEKYNVVDEIKLETLNGLGAKAYVLIDWSKVASNTGYAVGYDSTDELLDKNIGSLLYNNKINYIINPPVMALPEINTNVLISDSIAIAETGKTISDFVSKVNNYNYPFRVKQSESVRLSFSIAIIELYIEDYNPLYNYSLRVARKNQNGLGVPDGYTQLSISVMNAGVFVKDYELEKYNVVDEIKLETLNGLGAKAYVLIDWSKVASNTGYAVGYDSTDEFLDKNIGSLLFNNRIDYIINPPQTDPYPTPPTPDITLAIADNRYAYKNTDAYSKSQSDSRYALIGSASSSEYKFIDAADFGFLPNKTASENVIALQNAINGGNKTVTVSIPGDYLMNATVWIDDDTEILFGKGVAISISGSTWNVLCNRGALTRSWNENLRLKGLKIKCNSASGNAGKNSVLFGLNGVVNFFFIKNSEFDIEILDLAYNNFGFQLCTFRNIILDKVKLQGFKDGLHLGDGKGLIINNLESKTYDDALAFNAFDYAESNPTIGDIEDVTVHNFTSNWSDAFGKNDSRCINVLMGSVTEWVSGMPIVHGDAVYIEGKTYRSLLSDKTQTITSTTKPDFSSFSGVQTTAESIEWKLISNSEVKTASVKNVRINNMIHVEGYKADALGSSSHMFLVIQSGADTDGAVTWSRSVHPNVLEANYPYCDIRFNKIRTSKGLAVIQHKLGYNLTINDLKGKNDNATLIYVDTIVKKKSNLTLLDSDFNGMSPTGLNIKGNTDLVIRNCKHVQPLGGDFTGTRVNSDVNISFPNYLLSSVNGDMIVNDGQLQLYKSGSWVVL